MRGCCDNAFTRRADKGRVVRAYLAAWGGEAVNVGVAADRTAGQLAQLLRRGVVRRAGDAAAHHRPAELVRGGGTLQGLEAQRQAKINDLPAPGRALLPDQQVGRL